jgi:hypothetical protein
VVFGRWDVLTVRSQLSVLRLVAIWIIAFLASRDSSYGTLIGFNCGIAQISIKMTDLSASENTFQG